MLSRLSRIVASSSASNTPQREDDIRDDLLVELNKLLGILADIFPAHDVGLLRDLLLNASPESRLHVSATILLQHPRRFADKQTRMTSRLADWEKFRPKKYRRIVKELLVAEYKGLAKSTIHNVLAENNHDYVRSRSELADIASKSWRFSLTKWISRRNAPPPLPHFDDTMACTGCLLLDDEIYALAKPERDAQSMCDEQLARTINENEHNEAHALLECGCCFGDCTWEDITTCTNGHFFCRACLDRSVKQALYGQGSCLCPAKASVRCISSVATPPCDGFVTPALLAQSLPPDTRMRMEERFARDQLQSAGLPLVRCPACSYAVIDCPPQGYLSPSRKAILLLLLVLYLLYSLITLTALPCLFTPLLLSCTLPAGLLGISAALCTAHARVCDAMTRVRRRKMGVPQRFQCENPRCGMESCIDCARIWRPFHSCHREDNRRLYIERAMSEAVKRTCPKCHTSFVKTDGCNKLTCPCGYEMCYVCRADVRGLRYMHFCQHFRVVPGTACAECDRCNLYETEDEQAVAAAAARRAAEEWAVGKRGEIAGVARDVQIERARHADGVWPPWVEKQVEQLIEILIEW